MQFTIGTSCTKEEEEGRGGREEEGREEEGREGRGRRGGRERRKELKSMLLLECI